MVKQDQALDEKELWALLKQTLDPAIRIQLIERYRAMVKIIATQIYKSRIDNSIDFVDLFQSGMVGLLEAMERYQPEQGVLFKTFASARIRGEIMNFISSATEVSSQISQRKKRLKERVSAIDHADSASLSPLELLTSLSIGLAIGFMLEESTLLISEEGNHTAIGDNAYHSYAISQLSTQLHNQVKILPSLQQQVIQLHYYNHFSFTDIAQILQISKGRVSQLHQQGLLALRMRV